MSTAKVKKGSVRHSEKRERLIFHLMLLPGMIVLALFVFVPLVGSLMAFQNYKIGLGLFRSEWVGLENYRIIFTFPDSVQVFWNTLVIAFGKLVLNAIIPVAFSILLNELGGKIFKRAFQTVVYLPHFLSWVVLATVVTNMFSLDGPINSFLGLFGIEGIQFLADNSWFRTVIIGTDVWKEFGYNSVIYLAALLSIDPGLSEAASIDGASRFKQIMHITLPSLMPTVVLMVALSLGNILNAGFDQVFNLYNPIVYETGDIIDTFVYRLAFNNAQFSVSTAAGLFKSVISCVMIVISYAISYRVSGYRVF